MKKQLELDLDGRDSFTILWNENKELLMKFIRTISDDPDELFAQVGHYAWRGYRKFNGTCKFSTWLCTIAKNTNINNSTRRYKKEELNASDYLENLQVTSKEICGFTSACNEELRETIMAAIEKLPEPQKDIFVKHEIEGMSHREISLLTGIPEGTIRTRLFYAKQELQVQLAHLKE